MLMMLYNSILVEVILIKYGVALIQYNNSLDLVKEIDLQYCQ